MSTNIKSLINDKKQKKILREVLAPVIWIYVVLKVIIDFDAWLIYEHFPSFSWVIYYRPFFLLGIVAILYLKLGKSKFWKLVGFCMAYPFILILWRIPKALLKDKSWIGIFACLDIVAGFCKNFKWNLIMLAAVAPSFILVFTTNSKASLSLAISVLFIFLCTHFFGIFKFSLQPTSFSEEKVRNLNEKGAEQMKKHFNTQDIKKFDENNKVNSSWLGKLELLVISSNCLYFLKQRLRNFQKSSFFVMYPLSHLIYTFFVTVIVFAVNNFALYKADYKQFVISSKASLGEFFYYSFNSIFFNGIREISPAATIAKIFNCMEMFFAFLIGVILITLLITIRREKDSKEIENAIILIEKQTTYAEELLLKEFSVTPEQAVEELVKMQSSTLKLINFFISQNKYFDESDK